MHNRPGLVLLVIIVLMATMLTYRKLTRETFEVEEKTGHQISKEDYAEGRESRTPTFPLAFPLDCKLGQDCWIARYMDQGVGDDVKDFKCNASTQNAHKGTDFTLADLSQMQDGVAVLAAAAGKVSRIRDNMADVSVQQSQENAVDGRECGNAVIIEHIGGWQTQYCHMKKGSILVSPGQNVSTGDKIGEIGLSGQTEYPHLHFSVRHNTVTIDPFDGGAFQQGCDKSHDPLWRTKIDYQEFTLLPAQFTHTPQEKADYWQPGAQTLPSDSPALILTARVFHARVGDTLDFRITDPAGAVFLEADHTVEKDRQYLMQYVGKKRPDGGFAHGTWTGIITLSRDGSEPQTQSVEITVTP